MTKKKRLVNPKILRAAQGQPCTLQIPGHCNFNPDTTVAAHLQFEGGIMGSKTDDISVAFSCSECHKAIDAYLVDPEDRYFYMGRGLYRTWKILIQEGLIKLP